MLKSISMHRRDNKWIVKFNFVTSCLAFSGLIPTNSHQSQKQTGHCRKNLLHNHITILYYYTKLGSTSSLCVFFSSGTLELVTVPLLSLNRILDNIVKGTTHKPKGFLCCYRSNKNHLECTHTQRQTCESPYQTESLILGMKGVPTHHKDLQTYNPSFSKDI